MNFSKEVFINHLEKLSNEIGVSGHEDNISRILSKKFSEQELVIKRDALGGIYASTVDFTAKTTKKRVLICGHMDEVGFIAREILANGLVKVKNVGGIVNESLFGIRVCFYGKGKKVGVFTAVPAHFASANAISTDDLSIDFGFENEEDARNNGMVEGTIIGFDSTFEKTANPNRFLGKAFDNRYSCAMLATLADNMEKLHAENPEIEIVLGATTMEEIGLKGAEAAVNLVQPDFVIILDCSPAADTLPKDNKNGVLGNGVLYRYIDRTSIMTERVKRYFLIVLEKHEVKYQAYTSAGSTDGGKMVELSNGIPLVTCCVPSRYVHNSTSIMDIRDAEQAYNAVLALTANYREDIHNYLHYKNEEN